MPFRHIFSTQPKGTKVEEKGLTPEQQEILDKIAKKVVLWKMSTPAILFLESVKPLNYIGSQMLVFFEPFVQTLFSWKEYDEFRKIMEERENVERLLQTIEKFDAEALTKEKEDKKKRKEERKIKGRRTLWQVITGKG
jgi:vacuolar-type H+-ATPase subunit I/STV1